MDLPQAVRYRPYEKWSQKDYDTIIKKIAQSPWRSRFHVEILNRTTQRPQWLLLFRWSFPPLLSKLALWCCSWFEAMGTYDLHRPCPFYGNRKPSFARPSSR